MNQKKQKKLELLMEKYPGKQINRLISTRTDCPLSIFETIVLSFLTYRFKKDAKKYFWASAKKISKLSGLSRSTVSKSLKCLLEHELIKQSSLGWGVKLAGLQKNSDWFGWRGGGREFPDLAYHYFVQPAKKSTLSIIDALVYLTDQLEPGRQAALLAGRFGVSWNTIKRSRTKLQMLEYSSDWFADIEFPVKKPRDKAQQDFWKSFDGLEQSVVGKMLNTVPPWSQKDIERFLKMVKEKYPGSSEAYFNFNCTLLNHA
jgi:hypothetical protein